MDQPISDFARSMTDARRALHLTQAELATRIGCTQSAVSMFERGQKQALAHDKIEAIASLLNLPLTPSQEDPPTQSDLVRFCPLYDCPANQPFLVQQRLLVLPNPGAAGTGTHCRFCGEVLVSCCPGCGTPIHNGACCSTCGTPYILPPSIDTPQECRTWLEQQQQCRHNLLQPFRT